MWNVFDIQRLKQERHLPIKVSADMEYKYKSVNIFKTKHFLKINRTNRSERDIFMLFLNFEKLLDKCLISFPELHKWPDYSSQFYKYTQQENIYDLKSLMHLLLPSYSIFLPIYWPGPTCHRIFNSCCNGRYSMWVSYLTRPY